MHPRWAVVAVVPRRLLKFWPQQFWVLQRLRPHHLLLKVAISPFSSDFLLEVVLCEVVPGETVVSVPQEQLHKPPDAETTLVVSAPAQQSDTRVEFFVEFAAGQETVQAALDNGIRGGVSHALAAKRNLDETRSNFGETTPDPKGQPIVVSASSGEALAYLAGVDVGGFAAKVTEFKTLFDAGVEQLKDRLEKSEKNNDTKYRDQYSLDLLESGMI